MPTVALVGGRLVTMRGDDIANTEARRERVEITFGLGGAPWDPERVLERFELLLLGARRHGRVEPGLGWIFVLTAAWVSGGMCPASAATVPLCPRKLQNRSSR